MAERPGTVFEPDYPARWSSASGGGSDAKLFHLPLRYM